MKKERLETHVSERGKMVSLLEENKNWPKRVIRCTWISVAALAATAAFIVLTPLALSAIGKFGPDDWGKLSNEGQAYGGIASVFGILAVAGVAVSIVLQSRETALSRAQALRAAHSDLFFKAIDDPDLLACWGPFLQDNIKQERQQVYTNLVVSFWYSMFEIGSLRDEQVSFLAREMFKTVSGRRYWSVSGPVRLRLPTTNRELKFARIMDEQYVNTPELLETKSALPRNGDERSTTSALTIGAVGGIVIAGGLRAAWQAYRRHSTILQLHRAIALALPCSTDIDHDTAGLLHEHRSPQLRVRLKAGEGWADRDLVFCRDDGQPWNPDDVSKRFDPFQAQ